jgi:hypothetical protein
VQQPTRRNQPQQSLMHRVNYLAGEMNAFLVVLAIGLAILDTTCFLAMRTSDAIEQAIVIQQQGQQTSAVSDTGPAQTASR